MIVVCMIKKMNDDDDVVVVHFFLPIFLIRVGNIFACIFKNHNNNAKIELIKHCAVLNTAFVKSY